MGNAEGVSRPLAGLLTESPCANDALSIMILTTFSTPDARFAGVRQEWLRRSQSVSRPGRGVDRRRRSRMLQTAKAEPEPFSLDCLLVELQRQRFFGSIELKLESGHVVLIRKTETIKPAHDHRDNRRNRNERDD